MHVVIDCRMWHSGGIGTYLRNIVPYIVSLMPNSQIYLLGDVTMLDKLSSSKLEIIECTAPIYSIYEQIEFAKKIPKCDLFFSPQYNIPLAYSGIQITTIHDIFHITDENNNNTILKKLYAKTMLSTALRKSTIVFTDSNFTLEEMKKYNLPCIEKVRVVYLSSNLEKIKIDKNLTNRENKHILFVGNIKPHKNLVRLVEAYKKLHSKFKSEIPLLIVGELENFITGIPGFKEEINQSSWSKWITFTGKISDNELISYYKDASFLILPSLYEGFGLPPLEAMACGCPTLVSNVASLPEICGNAALYCDPYNTEDIANKMHQLLTDHKLRDKLIKNGFEQVQKFKWENTAKAFVDVIQKVVDC